MQVSCYSKLVVTTTLGQSEVFMILVHHLSPLNYLGPGRKPRGNGIKGGNSEKFLCPVVESYFDEIRFGADKNFR